MSKMNVLIVDDQINVVSGVLFGVHWDRVGVGQVYKAYNAYEARQVLKEKQVDIMLCDIEMPVENGLSLLAWCREQKMDLETIFLTAHADFLYAKEAVALGSFDYILQPARYEEIEDAVRRASEKIRLKRQMREDSDYGQLLKNKKGVILGSMMADLFSRDPQMVEAASDALKRIGVSLDSDIRVCLLDVVRWGKGLERWDPNLLYDTISNVLEELFYPYAWKTLLYQRDRGIYYVLLCTDSGAELNEESLHNQLERFETTFLKFFDCAFAVYYGVPETGRKIYELADALEKMDQDNVGRREGVYPVHKQEQSTAQTEEHYCENWVQLLENELYDTVVKDTVDTLQRLSAANRLNSKNLMRFYQKIMGVIYLILQKLNLDMEDLFPDEETMQRAMEAYSYTEDTLWLVKYVTARLHELRNTEAGKETQIDEIYQYIRSHMDEDIKRDDIADAVHLNANYISAMFKNKTGLSLKEYIISEKMSLARKMVRETGLPISVIAMKVGYTNFSHFSQSYKKINGVSPTEDREEMTQTTE